MVSIRILGFTGIRRDSTLTSIVSIEYFHLINLHCHTDDDSNNVVISGDIQARTTWTLLIYLTSPATGCVGGETVFYPEPSSKKAPPPEPIAIGLEVGMALFHRHGAECMLHEGREVLAGEKWVIRSDLCVRR